MYKFWTDVEQVDVENEVSKEYTEYKLQKPRKF